MTLSQSLRVSFDLWSSTLLPSVLLCRIWSLRFVWFTVVLYSMLLLSKNELLQFNGDFPVFILLNKILRTFSRSSQSKLLKAILSFIFWAGKLAELLEPLSSGSLVFFSLNFYFLTSSFMKFIVSIINSSVSERWSKMIWDRAFKFFVSVALNLSCSLRSI